MVPLAGKQNQKEMIQRLTVHIKGAVQGVGFRPFIYRLATSRQLKGYVLNSTSGVTIEVEGVKPLLDEFLMAIGRDKPRHAIIHSLEFSFLDPIGFSRFEIKESREELDRSALILPDIATCQDCLRELFDPTDRRYLYPFINCTHCGPRFSIIESLPYDRPNTSMKIFTMCPDCQKEYHNPNDRRFHAQPIACPACGPHLELWDVHKQVLAHRQDALVQAVKFIQEGYILALKGLGGFQLIVDANNPDAIKRLRLRKHREEKPFALMFPDLPQIKAVCEVSDFEERLLQSPESPILLLRRKPELQISNEIPFLEAAPGNPNLGIMLPYTPLHHLLLHYLGAPIIATSGNLSEEPMVIDEQEAVNRLGDIADYFLVHNRPIVRQVDDSIVRVILGRELVLRRARGYAPLPIQIPFNEADSHPTGESMLGVGAHLKNTVAIQKNNNVFVSQHIGDLSTNESLQAFQKIIVDFQNLYEVKPDLVISDLHPDYLSTQYANQYYSQVISAQHHEAHIAACRLENQIKGIVLGVSWDGTGLGRDNSIWGGEFFISDDFSFFHKGQLRKFPLPGGEEAIREPRRSALGILYQIYGENLTTVEQWLLSSFRSSELSLLLQMMKKKVNCPLTSSAGRLFDAVSALLKIRQQINYEGQAAMMLEYMADPTENGFYDVELIPGEIITVDWQPMLEQIVKQIADQEKPEWISMRFHNTLARLILKMAQWFQIEKVVLSGGCFQNAILLEKTVRLLQENGFRPYWHQRIPPNDGGISLGQIAIGWQQRKIHQKNKVSINSETEKNKIG